MMEMFENYCNYNGDPELGIGIDSCERLKGLIKLVDLTRQP
jgi:hypothetical protein